MPSFRKSIIFSKYGLYFPPGRTETGLPYLDLNCCSVSPSRLDALPAMLTRAQREIWLFGAVDCAGTALAAYPDERLLAYAVSARINSPHNNDEALLEPLETDVD